MLVASGTKFSIYQRETVWSAVLSTLKKLLASENPEKMQVTEKQFISEVILNNY